MGIARMYGRAAIAALAALMLVGATGLIGYNQGLSTLSISQTVDPSRIFVKGSGVNPEVTTVAIQLTAPKSSARLTADVILVVDRSASFEVDEAVSAAGHIIDRLDPNDRVGLVSFATEATLDAPLTAVSSAQNVRDALAKLVADGKTALGEGIAVATDELTVNGRPEAALVEILLTDGRPNFGRDALDEAKKAADQNVVIESVGIGSFVNRDLLTQLAETTGGQFFSTFNDAIVDQIFRVSVPSNQPVATNIQITETISKEFNFEEAVDSPPSSITHNSSDGTTTLSWQRSSLQAGETWIIRYTVSGSEEGVFPLHQSPSSVQFTDFRNRTVQKDLPSDLNVTVRPRALGVTANFSFKPENPTTFDTIQFTDESKLESGKIVRWLWDFGDGTTSTEQNPTHRYTVDGSYRVMQSVTSDEGVEAVNTTTLTVFTPQVAVRRTINTYLPSAQTIPGQTFRVTVEILVNTKLNGLGIDENLPSGWTITPIESSTAQVRTEDSQWLFSEVLEQGATKTIIYDVSVPQNQTAGVFPINGMASSASPRLSLPVRGDNQIEVLSGFPIAVVVAHWDGSKGALNLQGFPNHTIDLNQILQAISWWRQGVDVPSTEDTSGKKQKIDFPTMQSLVAYWLTNTSVFDKLPQQP